MEYQKPALTYSQQLDLLISRGLRVDNREKAIRHLQNISYYRLSGYFRSFQQNDYFDPKVSIEDVMLIYNFDQRLRSLVLEAIEHIEIALRTKIIYHLSHKYGIFGYLDPK